MHKLKELFESAVLTDDTKVAIQEAFEQVVEAKKVELEAEYAQKLVEAEQAIIDQIPTLVEEAVSEELAAIAEEVAHARTLEVQYAEKLNVFKESYAAKQEEQLAIMVAESVAEEIDELKEEIELAKKHQFALAMFESFRSTYEKMFGTSDISAYDELQEAKKELDQYKRTETINRLLECVQGEKRAIAETILEGVETDKLESKFESIRDVLLSESADKQADKQVKQEKAPEGKIVLESSEEEQPAVSDEMLNRLQKSLKFARGNK